MIAAVLGEPIGEILLGHVHPARIVIADIEHDQVATVVILRNVVDRRGAAESMHDAEADGIVIEHRRENAAHGAFLGPDLDPVRLLVPEVAAIGSATARRNSAGSSQTEHAQARASHRRSNPTECCPVRAPP